MIHKLRGGRDLADAERRFAHALERESKCAHVGDFASHEELQGILGAGVAAEIDQSFVDNLGARFRGDIAAKIDIQLAGDFEIIRRPCIAHGIEQVHAPTAGNSDERVDLRLFSHRFQRFEVHPRQSSDDFQMAEFLSSDIHQQVFSGWVIAVQALDRILHGGRKLAIGSAKLFKKHVAKARDPARRRERCT